ncbi:DOMON-like domain-containing protein [Sphingomonas sp. AR_OL41]|uniref:DOMON-like domain-containing protein n=1 Tax=Sphingomonas sp. AR_OL41 TaxID=3042729 RepID=UPI00247FCEE3|nr:DOMON-like domain-containing protein [Sphingomonas sp. AR_OL41]MDH7973177.1 DOMON-like domain-containing protein [Sphingomonas sp. AR_OL41]
MMLTLVPHPDFPSVAVTAIGTDVGRHEGGELTLRFFVEGDLDGVIWPQFDSPARRTDGLWQHSCFEAFVGFVDEPDYCELNFATSMKWAAYRFDTYRTGMSDIEKVVSSGHWLPGKGCAVIHFILPDLAAPREWRLGLSAIIEATDGTKSYWALAHPRGKPDFHNADCFTARLAAPERA